MKLTSLTIEDFRQFKNFRLDFTDPETGKPLEKVCFIGPNGTGKSTVLRLIMDLCIGQWQFGKRKFLTHFSNEQNGKLYQKFCSAQFSEGGVPIESQIFPGNQFGEPESISSLLAIYCPPEGEGGSSQSDPSAAILNNALDLLKNTQHKHFISSENIQNFWLWVIAHLKYREKNYLEYQRLPENLKRTMGEIIADFDRSYPQVLDGLSDVWDKILKITNLEFDRESVEVPVQLNEGLKAYLRTRTGKTRVGYEDLSTGIRHYLFRLGHIWSLYFNRPPGDSVLLIDEPESSLYPDFLYDIVGNYLEVAPGCQLFMATHSPIVASQFKPEERFLLEFGEDGYVTARRGISPEGDDPNDILRQDFGVESLMTEVGERAWERFLSLRRLIPKTPEPEKTALIEEYARLGSAYHFTAPGSISQSHEISAQV